MARKLALAALLVFALPAFAQEPMECVCPDTTYYCHTSSSYNSNTRCEKVGTYWSGGSMGWMQPSECGPTCSAYPCDQMGWGYSPGGC
jgi:hypothetical protein